jgi:hypothetical protein
VWTEVTDPSALPPAIESGTSASLRGHSHDGDSSAFATADWLNGATWRSPTLTIGLGDPINGAWSQTLGTVQVVPTGITYQAPECVRQVAEVDYGDGTSPPILLGYDCFVVDSVEAQRVENDLFATYSPTGDRVVIAVSRVVTRPVAMDNWHLCRDSHVGPDGIEPQRCITYHYQRRTEVTELWSVAVPSGAITPLPPLLGVAMTTLSMSEDGRELVTSQTAWTETWVTEWSFAPTKYPKYDFARTAPDCSVHFRNSRTLASAQSFATTAARCGHAAGGFAPALLPIGRRKL